jgi:class 3 adenylate cyclase
MHALTLAFPPDVEQAFRKHHFEQSLAATRAALLLGTFMFAMFGILDAWIVPEVLGRVLFIRFGLIIPLLLLVFAFTWLPAYERWAQAATAFAIACSGVAILAMITVAERPGRDLYYAGLILVIMYGYTFTRTRFVVATAVCWLLVAAYEVAAIVIDPTPFPILLNNNFFFVSANLIGMFAAYMLEMYERRDFLQVRQLAAQREQIAHERERAEELLFAILPKSVARRLQQHEQVADSFADVTVLFADISDFSSLAAQLPPARLVSLLNEIFSSFDALAEQHGLEKVKTIGDAYMAVAGLPIERDDHAEAMAEFAVAMREEIARHRIEGLGPINIRIGINTGPVIAGVIGRKKFIYDLWGDTVNIASRMESHGSPGQIQVTQSTYLRLKRWYDFEERPTVRTKRGVELRAYALVGRKPAAVAPALANH